MTLGEWLRANRKTNEWMAKAVPAHEVTIAKWRSGAALPSPGYLRRIMEVTGGEVTPTDFILGLKRAIRRGPDPQVNCSARSP